MKRIILALLCCSTAWAAEPAKTEPKAAKPAEPKAAEAKPAAKALVTYKDGIATPESVLYDEKNDEYLVSNINGSPLAKDNNGFISVLSPEGKVLNPKFIAGGQNGVTLNAPKGTAIVGDTLYVSDIDAVRMFDRKTGKPKGEVAIPGGTFANDICTYGGKVYVTDSGLKQGAKDFEPSGADAVYAVEKGKLVTLVKSKDLGHPNGCYADRSGLWVVNFGDDELWQVDLKGKKKGAVTKLPKGSLDGIFEAGGEFYVSSWAGSAVYRGKPGGTFVEVLGGQSSPADIGYDSKRKRLLVPHFMDNVVEVYELPAK
jgi:sugar lactone lactonase YvrE